MTSDAVKVDKSDKRDEGDEGQLSPEQGAATAMVAEARQRRLELTGPDGLLKLFTKNVLETALNEEMTGHLGYEKNMGPGCRKQSLIWGCWVHPLGSGRVGCWCGSGLVVSGS